jgi:hypothetical protein
MRELENEIFKQYSLDPVSSARAVFILGSPRTGSTLLYQLMINFFDLFYISNLTNDYFSSVPAVGALLHQTLHPDTLVSYESSYGKTSAVYEPSEGSKVMSKWFGGSHPSQINSTTVIPSMRDHLKKTVSSICAMSKKPFLIKNAWNCFRIENLSTLFPNGKFIWIRRDIGESATSDLKSRINQGNPQIWNSATTHNYREIQRRPPHEQVVLQQYEYNRAMGSDLQTFASQRYIEIWYEDICNDTSRHLGRLEAFLDTPQRKTALPTLKRSRSSFDNEEITSFIELNKDQFAPYRRKE